MASIKRELLKKINKAVERKKELSKNLERNKTLYQWAVSFFDEVDKAPVMANFELNKLLNKIKGLDRGAKLEYYEEDDNMLGSRIEITWSPAYVAANKCDNVFVIDAASAYFNAELETL